MNCKQSREPWNEHINSGEDITCLMYEVHVVTELTSNRSVGIFISDFNCHLDLFTLYSICLWSKTVCTPQPSLRMLYEICGYVISMLQLGSSLFLNQVFQYSVDILIFFQFAYCYFIFNIGCLLTSPWADWTTNVSHMSRENGRVCGWHTHYSMYSLFYAGCLPTSPWSDWTTNVSHMSRENGWVCRWHTHYSV